MAVQSRAAKRIGESHASLQERAKAEIQKKILTGRLKPGERLVESKLAVELGVSRNPIREAIRALASEGLVEINARRGAFVATMTQQEARETVELRALLEGHNARLAARRRDMRVLRRIENILRAGTEAVKAGRSTELVSLNQEFHKELAAAGQNKVMGELMRRLRERTAILFSAPPIERQARIWEEHADILRAILDGDERRAASLAARHAMRAGLDYFMESVDFSPLDLEKVD